MSNSRLSGFQHQARNISHETFNQPAFEDVGRSGQLSSGQQSGHVTEKLNQQFQSEHGHAQHLPVSPTDSQRWNSPRSQPVFPHQPNYESPISGPSSPSRTSNYIAAAVPNMNIPRQTHHNTVIPQPNMYSAGNFMGAQAYPFSNNQILPHNPQPTAIPTSPPFRGYHPPVFTVRSTSQGSNEMYVYETPRILRPSSQDGPEVEPKLHPEYKQSPKPRKFFKGGKVFMTLWAEPAGNVHGSLHTSITEGVSKGSFGEPVFCKIRRFVVVREGDQACAALPIVTYGHKGVAKPGVKKSEHAIIHTGKLPPEPHYTELPKRGEAGLLSQAIRVDPDDPLEKLDPWSRIDFAKLYTIHHNVKVRSVGMVNRASIQPLLYQFKVVWRRYFGDSEPESAGPKRRPSQPVNANTKAPCSKHELIAALKALRIIGLTPEQAREPLVKAGFQLSGDEFDEQNWEDSQEEVDDSEDET